MIDKSKLQNNVLPNWREIKKLVQKNLRRLPAGRLLVVTSGHRTHYFQDMRYTDGNRRKSISKDESMIYRMAHKAFLTELLRRLEHNISELEKVAPRLFPLDDLSILASLPANYARLDQPRIIDPYLHNRYADWPNPSRDPAIKPRYVVLKVTDMTPEEWAATPYCENTSFLEHKIHRTSRGILCRAKGEAAILELCDRHGYRYHYDEVVCINGRRISPDIIIIKPDGTLLYVEHRGWKGEGYDKHNMWKDNQYFSAGIVQGWNYLVTFENADGSIDPELIERQLENMMGY